MDVDTQVTEGTPRLDRRQIDDSAIRTTEHADLFEQARRGDPEAIPALMQHFGPLVKALAWRQCCCQADADDVVQDVWVALLSNLDKIHSPSCLPGWLQRVTINAARKQARRNRAEPVPCVPEPLSNVDEDAELRPLLVESTRRGVHGALGRLRESDRALIELLMDDDRPDYRSISEVICRPVGSIGPTRERVLRRLRVDPDIARLAMR